MQEVLTQYPNILLIMLILSGLEWFWARQITKRRYDARASLASLGVAVGQALIKPLGAGFIAMVYGAAYQHALLTLSRHDWRVWLLGFFAVEFAYYWFHRWSHSINWLWATHAVHHSPNELTLPAALRLGWTGVISGGWMFFLPLVVIGFPPKMIGLLLAFNLLYQFGLHTETIRKLGPLEWLFNTPSHHRAHHASDTAWLDCNFGGVLIIFDRLFDTFVAEPDEGGLKYGLTEPLYSYSPVRIALNQWAVMLSAFKAASSNRQRLAVLFGKPAVLDHTPRSFSRPQVKLSVT